ncbi:membrane protein [Jeotgalibacillus soli]|uniref:Membrane protein n=1 Tax=Jeotgalibacillus soli TaxID=889306 RepID=A0A0C2VT64_9BACL|nr:membrane protein [Jeotgalibacillus soli]KIL52117.1 membrane protein [Jeotgalibacillus soli]
MELFGYTLESMYLILLLISGTVTLLYLFFGDAVEGIGEAISFFNPTTILGFIALFSASGYLFESLTSLSSFVSLPLSIAIASVLSFLLHFFILVPLKSAEESLAYTEESLGGRIGKVIIPIPADGFGEVFIESYSGMISKPASSYDNVPIAEGKQVLIIDVAGGVLHVKEYETSPIFYGE